MLVFCQLLIKRNKGRGLEESLPEIQPRESDVESGEGSCTYFLVIYVNSRAAFLTPSSRQNLVHAQNSDFRQLLFSFLLLFRTMNLILFVLKHLLTSSFSFPPPPYLDYTRETRLPRVTCKAANRWHLAVTLLRNPSLIKYRKQGGQRVLSFVNLASINNDDSALV